MTWWQRLNERLGTASRAAGRQLFVILVSGGVLLVILAFGVTAGARQEPIPGACEAVVQQREIYARQFQDRLKTQTASPSPEPVLLNRDDMVALRRISTLERRFCPEPTTSPAASPVRGNALAPFRDTTPSAEARNG